jgi:hypothetical protein
MPAGLMEPRKRPEKIIDRKLAEQRGFVLDYPGPLTKNGRLEGTP